MQRLKRNHNPTSARKRLWQHNSEVYMDQSRRTPVGRTSWLPKGKIMHRTDSCTLKHHLQTEQ